MQKENDYMISTNLAIIQNNLQQYFVVLQHFIPRHSMK